RRAEGGGTEQPQIQQRLGQPVLSADEHHPGRKAGRDKQGRRPPEAIPGELLEPVGAAGPPDPHTIPQCDYQQAKPGPPRRPWRPPGGLRPGPVQAVQPGGASDEPSPVVRAVATRYDKLAARCQAAIMVADIVTWLRARPDHAHDDPGNTP